MSRTVHRTGRWRIAIAILAVGLLSASVMGQGSGAARLGKPLSEDSDVLDENWSIRRPARTGADLGDERGRGFGPSFKRTGIEHTAKQYGDLPDPAVADLPDPNLTTLSRVGQTSGNHPFTVDWVFISRSGVEDTTKGVLINEIGFNFTGRSRFWSDKVCLTYRPFFDVIFFSGPETDVFLLPEQIYKVAIDLQFDYMLSNDIALTFGVTPGLWTDFVVTSTDDIRLPARFLGSYRINDSLWVAAGVVYTDNIRRNLLPTAGMIWDATDRLRFEMMIPRSRVIYKFHPEILFYGALESGRDTWNLRTLGEDEDFEYRDLRILLGSEVNLWAPASLFVETGAAVYRKFRFDLQGEYDIDPGFFVRAGTRF